MKAEHLQVDQLVDIAQALLGALPLVEARSPGRPDPGAHQSDENRGAGPRAQSFFGLKCGSRWLLVRHRFQALAGEAGDGAIMSSMARIAAKYPLVPRPAMTAVATGET